MRRPAAQRVAYGNLHGQARGDTIVHDDRRLAFHRRGFAPAQIQLAATARLLALGLDFPPEPLRIHARDFLLVAHHLAAFHDGTDSVFGLQGMADLARDEEIERHGQSARHFHTQHHTAARQGIHHAILFLIFFQRLRKQPARFGAVPEVHVSPMRNSECGMRNNQERFFISLLIPHSEFRTPHSTLRNPSNYDATRFRGFDARQTWTLRGWIPWCSAARGYGPTSNREATRPCA